MRPNNNLLNFGSIASPNTAPVAYSNWNSIAQWALDIVRCSFQVVASGTAAGTLQIQASNDQSFGLPANQFQPTNWFNVGTAATIAGAGAYEVGDVFKTSVLPLECSYEYLRLTFVSTKAGVQTIAPIADTGVLQVQTVTTAADVAGSLNSTYFLLSSINTTTKAQKNFYVWFNINSAGVDPAIAGRTAIPITGATNVSANTLATSIRSALNGLTGDFVATGAGAAVIITNVAPGPVTAAADGAAPTGFSFGSATAGVASNLNNTYFLLSAGNSGINYYVWMNVSGIGTDPAVAGKTGIEVAFTAAASAGTIGTAMASAIAAAHSSADFTASGTTTVTVTNLQSGPFVPASDVSTGFTFAITAPTGTLIARMKSMGL